MRRTLLALFVALGLLSALPASAALTCTSLPEGVTNQQIEEKWIHVSVPIPGVTVTCLDDRGTPDVNDNVTRDYIQDLGAYIGGLYKFLAGAIGILATVMVFYGGIQWIAAAGNASRIKDAKETIFSSLIGVVIALGSYLLLYVINPNLINLRPPALKSVVPIEQVTALCQKTPTCQSGPKLGTACTTDSDCGTTGAGACAYPFALDANEKKPVCGKEYTYTLAKAGAATCTGAVCADSTKTCARGYMNDDFGLPVFVSDPVNGDSYGCVDKALACDQVDDTLAGVGPGRHDNLCSPFSEPGVSLCKWYTNGSLTSCDAKGVIDYCKTWPVLTCPKDYPVRVGGEVCGREAVEKGRGAINFGTLPNPSPLFASVEGSCYDASAAEIIYDGTLKSTGQVIESQCEWDQKRKLFGAVEVRGICCMKAAADPATATKADLACHVSQ